MRIEPLRLTSITDVENTKSAPSANIGKSFGSILTEALNDVNDLQLKAGKASVDLAAGKIQDISEVTIATEKATIALQLTLQVRNKVVESYQEIMRMQV